MGPASLEQQARSFLEVIGRLQGEGALEVPQGLLEGRRAYCPVAGQRQEVDRLLQIGTFARLAQVIGQLRRVLLHRRGVGCLDRIGCPQV